MSSAHDAHGVSAHAHDDHDAFDGEPAKELSPGEPRSPAWLPALGLALFSLAGVYMLSGGDEASTHVTAPRPLPVEPAAVAANAVGTPPPAPPRPAPPSMRNEPGAAPSAMGSVRKLTPEQIEDLKKKMGEARAKGGQPAPGRPAPPKRK